MDQSEEFLENPRVNHLPSLKGLNCYGDVGLNTRRFGETHGMTTNEPIPHPPDQILQRARLLKAHPFPTNALRSRREELLTRSSVSHPSVQSAKSVGHNHLKGWHTDPARQTCRLRPATTAILILFAGAVEELQLARQWLFCIFFAHGV